MILNFVITNPVINCTELTNMAHNANPPRRKLCSIKSVGRSKGLKILHHNIRSLWAHIDSLKIELAHSQIDILTISETWLKTNIDSKLVEIPNYTLIRHDRETQNANNTTKQGGGASNIPQNRPPNRY